MPLPLSSFMAPTVNGTRSCSSLLLARRPVVRRTAKDIHVAILYHMHIFFMAVWRVSLTPTFTAFFYGLASLSTLTCCLRLPSLCSLAIMLRFHLHHDRRTILCRLRRSGWRASLRLLFLLFFAHSKWYRGRCRSQSRCLDLVLHRMHMYA